MAKFSKFILLNIEVWAGLELAELRGEVERGALAEVPRVLAEEVHEDVEADERHGPEEGSRLRTRMNNNES